jgi:hypothetical protein
MNDGGSFRQCVKCRKQFRAQIQQEQKQPEQRQRVQINKIEVSAHHPYYLPNSFN